MKILGFTQFIIPVIVLISVPEHIKSSFSQPQSANQNSSTSTVTCAISNAKRAPASGQPQALPRYPLCEVSSHLCQHKQKELLKRGQSLTVLAATLGTQVQLNSSQPGELTTERSVLNCAQSHLSGTSTLQNDFADYGSAMCAETYMYV